EKNDNFACRAMISRPGQIATRPPPVTLPAQSPGGTPRDHREVHTIVFCDPPTGACRLDRCHKSRQRSSGFENKIALTACTPVSCHLVSPRRASAYFPSMSSSVAVGALVGWMLLLTVKHIVADFMLQNSWMAIGKDQKTGLALPLLAHGVVHLAVSLLLIMVVAPRFWFVAFIDFAIHITVDRLKGICASSF